MADSQFMTNWGNYIGADSGAANSYGVMNTTTGGMGGAATTAFGAASMASPYGWVLAGISNYLGKKSERKQNEDERRARKDEIAVDGDEDRKTAFYQALVEDWKGQKDKFRKGSGLDNYLSYAKSQGGYTNQSLNKMMNFNSPNQIKDPGAMPIPSALMGRSTGSDSRGWKPQYEYTEEGGLVPRRG